MHVVHGVYSQKVGPLATGTDLADDPIHSVSVAKWHILHAFGRHHPSRSQTWEYSNLQKTITEDCRYESGEEVGGRHGKHILRDFSALQSTLNIHQSEHIHKSNWHMVNRMYLFGDAGKNCHLSRKRFRRSAQKIRGDTWKTEIRYFLRFGSHDCSRIGKSVQGYSRSGEGVLEIPLP